MISGNLLNEITFSLRLSRGANDGLGELVLGGVVDETYYDVDFVKIPVTPHTAGFAEDDNWKADAQSLSLGDGSKINVDFKSPTIAVFGSTYPWMSLLASISDALNAFMESKNWDPLPFVNCTKRSSWPDVTIVI
jgi:Eukaryotic aspartyl protease